MRSAIDGVDVVGKTEDRFGVSVVVLQRDFHGHALALGFHVDRLVVQNALAAIQVLDELGDAAVVLELGALGFASLGIVGPFIGERDQQALVKEGHLAQALRQGVVVVFRSCKDLPVRQKADFGPALLGVAGFLQLAGGLTLGVGLLPHRALTPDL